MKKARAVQAEMNRLMERRQMDRDDTPEIVTRVASGEKVPPQDRLEAVAVWAGMTGNVKRNEGDGPNLTLFPELLREILMSAIRTSRTPVAGCCRRPLGVSIRRSRTMDSTNEHH